MVQISYEYEPFDLENEMKPKDILGVEHMVGEMHQELDGHEFVEVSYFGKISRRRFVEKQGEIMLTHKRRHRFRLGMGSRGQVLLDHTDVRGAATGHWAQLKNLGSGRFHLFQSLYAGPALMVVELVD